MRLWSRSTGIMVGALFGSLVSPGWGQQLEEDFRISPTNSRAWVIEAMAGMQFVLLPAGELLMGSPEDVIGREPQEIQHLVRITRPFYLGRTEVTQEQWSAIMGENPSRFSDCGECPVENISWFDTQEFIGRLNARTGEHFRLPTEAEWEYACRAGTTSPFHSGESLTTDQANYDGRYPYPGHSPGIYREKTTVVGSFDPNPWGLYDLHGNVWEWCQDRHCPYFEGDIDDPLGDCDSEIRVIRGGSWYFNADSARCGLRYTHRPQDIGPSLGFRLVRETLPP